MEVDKDEHKIVERALASWQEEGVLSEAEADRLRGATVVRNSDRQQVAQYFFFIALCCTLLAFGAIFLSEKLLEKIKAYFAWGDLAIALITAVLSVLWFWYTVRKRGQTRSSSFEIYMALGGLSVLTSLVYVCKYIHADATYYTAFLTLAFIVLGVIAVILESGVLWIGALISMVCWYGAITSVFNEHYLFLGMNYPVRYIFLGLIILALSFLQRKLSRLRFSQQTTYIIGLSVFFVSLWLVSIFGNFNSIERWQHARQLQVLIYSGFLAAASGLSFYLGIRFKDSAARDFGVLFILFNLYTRYFEYFWDTMNKGIFFVILAVTFGVLGRWLERKSKAASKVKAE